MRATQNSPVLQDADRLVASGRRSEGDVALVLWRILATATRVLLWRILTTPVVFHLSRRCQENVSRAPINV